MKFYNVAVLMLAAAPLYAQRAEVYGLGGYSHTWDRNSTAFGSWRAVSANGGFFGGGAGVRVAGIFGVQGEFYQIRNPRSSAWPAINTGALNFVLEKRTGRYRPGGIVLGLGGGNWAPGKDFLMLQVGAGVAVQLTERLFLRPQVRLQTRLHRLFSDDPTSVSVGAALGYRF